MDILQAIHSTLSVGGQMFKRELSWWNIAQEGDTNYGRKKQKTILKVLLRVENVDIYDDTNRLSCVDHP